jgi:hypothetical protein
MRGVVASRGEQAEGENEAQKHDKNDHDKLRYEEGADTNHRAAKEINERFVGCTG